MMAGWIFATNIDDDFVDNVDNLTQTIEVKGSWY